MSYPDPPDALALALPVDPFDWLAPILPELDQRDLPAQFPPAMSGSAIWDDIWSAVEQFFDFLGYPGRIMGWIRDRIGDVGRWIWDIVGWFWTNAIDPIVMWAGAQAALVWDWCWFNYLRPFLDSLWNHVWGTWDWFWTNAVRPFLVSLWDHVWNTWSHFWTSALYPFLDSLWGHVWSTWDWFWANAVRPFLVTLWDHVWGTWEWWWFNVVQPKLDWIWNHIGEAWDWWWFNVLEPKLGELLRVTLEGLQTVTSTVVNIGMAGAQAIGSGFEAALKWFWEHVLDPFVDAIRVKLSIPGKFLRLQYNSLEEILEDLEDPLPTGHLANFMIGIAAIVPTLAAVAMAIGQIYAQETAQTLAQRVGRTIPTFADLRDAKLRGLMEPDVHDDWLGRAGYSEKNIDIINELYYDIPTPSDLVRMAVREVFSPDIVDRFGLFDEFPSEFAKWADQSGISEFWAKAHWGAHWTLPSVTQAFGMLHRVTETPAAGGLGGSITVDGETFDTVISRETLDLLLRTQDVMPFWREPLTAIAYRVASRIDIRRMFRVGVSDRRDVLSTYLSLGYEPQVALALTEYVTRESVGIDKDLPRQTIMMMYRDHILGPEETREELREMGLSDESIELLMSQEDFRAAQQIARLAEDVIEADFKAGVIGDTEALGQLAELGVPTARGQLLVDLWTRRAKVRTAELTASQLQRLYRENIILEPALRERLALLGHNETDIDFLVQLSTPDPEAEPKSLTLSQTQAALRAGLIDVGEFTTRLEVFGYDDTDISVLIDLTTPGDVVEVRALTVSQLQRAHRDGIIDEAELRSRLGERGYSGDDAEVLVALARPGVAERIRELTVSQLQRAYREGLIDEGELARGLGELGYTTEAAGILKSLAEPPAEAPPRALTVSQLQRALVRGMIGEAVVLAQLAEMGFSAAGAEVLIALARPEEIVKERDLTVAQSQRAFKGILIAESDLRARLATMKFNETDIGILVELARPAVIPERVLKLTVSQLQRAYREGLIDEGELDRRLGELGYTPEAAGILKSLAEPPAEAAPRALTVSQLQRALVRGMIPEDVVQGQLVEMGFSAAGVEVLIALARPEELVKERDLTVAQSQKAFRAVLIAESDLRARLVGQGFSETDIAILVELARPAVIPERILKLTVSQLQSAYREGIIDRGELGRRLEVLGYTTEAAEILVKLARPPAEAAPRALTVSQLQRALVRGMIPEDVVRGQLVEMGFSAAGVEVLIALARPEELVKERDLTVAQSQKAFREALIAESDLRGRLAGQGFSGTDIAILVELARPPRSPPR